MPQGWIIDEGKSMTQHYDATYTNTQYYLQLKWYLNDSKQVAWNLFQYLTHGIHGHKSTIDLCLYMWHNCFMVVYTDDSLFFSRDDSTIDVLIESLSETYLGWSGDNPPIRHNPV